MVKVKYPARILIDKDFILWLIDNDRRCFYKLTHIKNSSMDYKKRHNLILEEHIKEITKTGKIKEMNLRAAFKGIPVPDSVSKVLDNAVDQLVVIAILLATEAPYKTYLFTNKENVEKYQKSKHYGKIKSVSIKTGKDAVIIINSFWQQWVNQKEALMRC